LDSTNSSCLQIFKWYTWHQTGCLDRWDSGRNCYGGILLRHADAEHDDAREPGRDGVGERDGAGGELRPDHVHGGRAGHGHGVRVDGVVVGDVGAVPDVARGAGHAADDLDDGRAGRYGY
jgi:hypothetical protein